MARNTTLGTLRSMVKSETGKSLDATATAQDAEINQVICDIQQYLSSEYDWPFLASRWTMNIAAGTRYVTFPTGINFERAGALQAFIKWNQVWQEVNYGIDEQSEFNYIDSDLGAVLDPIQRWKFDDEGMFEVWPLPASPATFRFVGQRVNTSLLTTGASPVWDDTAKIDLDDLLVCYYVSAEYLTREQQTDNAKLLLTMAQDRLRLIRATYPTRERPATIMGGTSKFDRRTLRVVPMVVVGGR